MKRVLCCLLCLALLLVVLPVNARAYSEPKRATVTNYIELEEALNEPEMEYITIIADGFGWPEEAATVLIEEKSHWLTRVRISEGDLVVPEHILLDIRYYICLDNDPKNQLVVDGAVCFSNGGYCCGDMIINGEMYLPDGGRGYFDYEFGDLESILTINGTLYNGGCFSPCNGFILGDGAVIKDTTEDGSATVSVAKGSVSCPEGSATIEGAISHSGYQTSLSYEGKLLLDTMELSHSDQVTIAENADVTVKRLDAKASDTSPAILNVDGHLTITDGSDSGRILGTVMNLSEDGELILKPGSVYGKTNYTKDYPAINGNGTVRFYADVTENDDGTVTVAYKPTLFGSFCDESQIKHIRPEYVEPTVRFWFNWDLEMSQCNHSYILGVCEFCGAIKGSGIATVPMYRMYDPNSGEHFYSGSELERDFLIDAGWHYEGVGFNFPEEGDPVYRLYDPVYGEHLYTMDNAEREKLQSWGWQYEGVAFNSAEEDEIPQYRFHNPNAKRGGYHFTGSDVERDFLISLGWIPQGIGWYSCLE